MNFFFLLFISNLLLNENENPKNENAKYENKNREDNNY